MSRVYAGAMMTIMALCVFGIALPIGGVNPEVAAPGYLLAALLGMLWAGRLLFAGESTWNSSPMHWPVAMFLVYAVVRYLTSSLEYAARVELFQVGVCALIYFVCATQFTRPSDRTFFLIALMILAVLESGYGVWQAMTKSDAVFQWLRPEGYRGRASGTFIYPNHLAAFLELVLGLVVARAALVRRESEKLEKSVILKVLTIYVVLMVVVGIVLTRSRAGWAAVVAGLSVFLFLGDWRPRFSFPRLLLVLGVMSGMAFCLWKLDFTRTHFLRTLNLDGDATTVSLSDPTLGGRVLMWKGTLKMIQEHPLFGTGAGSWQWIYQQHKDPVLLSRPEHTHNDFLNLTSDYGLVGLVIAGLFLVGCWRHLLGLSHGRHSPEKQAFAVGAMVSVSAILLHSWFDLSLHAPANALLFSAILGFVAAMEVGSRATGRREMTGWQRYSLGTAALAFCGIGVWFLIPTALAARYTDLGNLLARELEHDAALNYYDRAIALDPGSPEPYARRGDVSRTWANFRVGPEKAAERRALALQAIEAYERSLRLNPYQSFVLLDLARMQDLVGETDRALTTFKRAIEVYPANPVAHFQLGCFYRDHSEPDRAREAFAQSQKLYPSTGAGLNLLELEPKR